MSKFNFPTGVCLFLTKKKMKKTLKHRQMQTHYNSSFFVDLKPEFCLIKLVILDSLSGD